MSPFHARTQSSNVGIASLWLNVIKWGKCVNTRKSWRQSSSYRFFSSSYCFFPFQLGLGAIKKNNTLHLLEWQDSRFNPYLTRQMISTNSLEVCSLHILESQLWDGVLQPREAHLHQLFDSKCMFHISSITLAGPHHTSPVSHFSPADSEDFLLVLLHNTLSIVALTSHNCHVQQ